MSTLIDQPIVITDVTEGENKFGEMSLITYYKTEDTDHTERRAQTNSEVLIRQLQEQVEEGLPFETVVREVRSNKNNRYSFYTLGEPEGN
jgi:hypothetical protein